MWFCQLSDISCDTHAEERFITSHYYRFGKDPNESITPNMNLLYHVNKRIIELVERHLPAMPSVQLYVKGTGGASFLIRSQCSADAGLRASLWIPCENRSEGEIWRDLGKVIIDHIYGTLIYTYTNAKRIWKRASYGGELMNNYSRAASIGWYTVNLWKAMKPICDNRLEADFGKEMMIRVKTMAVEQRSIAVIRKAEEWGITRTMRCQWREM